MAHADDSRRGDTKSMATVTINGHTYSGRSVIITNGRVIIDGVPQDGTLSGVVEIRVTQGVLGELSTDASVTCGQVLGNVSAGGSVRCDQISGSVTAGGSVNCGNVGGSVSAGGSVRHR
jgi:hypothetical protein